MAFIPFTLLFPHPTPVARIFPPLEQAVFTSSSDWFIRLPLSLVICYSNEPFAASQSSRTNASRAGKKETQWYGKTSKTRKE